MTSAIARASTPIVHRDSALMRNRILECDVFHRFEDVVVLLQHVDLLKIE